MRAARAAAGTPTGVAADGVGHLYVADSVNAAVRKVDLATGTVTTLVGVLGQRGERLGPLPGGLSRPYGIAMAPSGAGVFIVDWGENAILAAGF